MPYGVLLIAAILVALLLAASGARRWRHSASTRQQRLGAAFERARRVRQAGTGEQGRPYSLYGEESWKH